LAHHIKRTLLNRSVLVNSDVDRRDRLVFHVGLHVCDQTLRAELRPWNRACRPIPLAAPVITAMRPYNLKVSAFNAMLPTIFTLSITSRENLLEITQGSKDSGIEGLEIYLWGTCMLTIMEVDQNFSLEKRAKADE
jgi:hypothetical protein